VHLRTEVLEVAMESHMKQTAPDRAFEYLDNGCSDFP